MGQIVLKTEQDVMDRMHCEIDSESVNIYIDMGEESDPIPIVYWHLEEVQEDPSVAISMATAVDMFHRDKMELINTLSGIDYFLRFSRTIT